MAQFFAAIDTVGAFAMGYFLVWLGYSIVGAITQIA